MLTKFPSGMVAVVSDSYNIWNACEHLWGEELRDLVIKRGESGGVLVVRPDSGIPQEVVVKVCTAKYTENFFFILKVFGDVIFQDKKKEMLIYMYDL